MSINRPRITAFFIGCSVVAALTAGCSSSESRPAMDFDRPGNAVGTRFMEYCESAENTSPAKNQQLAFLREHETFVMGDENLEGSIWIETEVPQPEEFKNFVAIRYFAGASDNPRCTFGLVRTLSSNHSDTKLDQIVRFKDGDRMYKPSDPDAPYCRSFAPPALTTDATTGATVVTIDCDFRL